VPTVIQRLSNSKTCRACTVLQKSPELKPSAPNSSRAFHLYPLFTRR
jgi:hypothetical protein